MFCRTANVRDKIDGSSRPLGRLDLVLPRLESLGNPILQRPASKPQMSNVHCISFLRATQKNRFESHFSQLGFAFCGNICGPRNNDNYAGIDCERKRATCALPGHALESFD